MQFFGLITTSTQRKTGPLAPYRLRGDPRRSKLVQSETSLSRLTLHHLHSSPAGLMAHFGSLGPRKDLYVDSLVLPNAPQIPSLRHTAPPPLDGTGRAPVLRRATTLGGHLGVRLQIVGGLGIWRSGARKEKRPNGWPQLAPPSKKKYLSHPRGPLSGSL